jgi:hypothetical protein
VEQAAAPQCDDRQPLPLVAMSGYLPTIPTLAVVPCDLASQRFSLIWLLTSCWLTGTLGRAFGRSGNEYLAKEP